MIVKTKLAEIQDQLSTQVETVALRGQGLSAFLYLANKGRVVEISEHEGKLWLELWEKSDDQNDAPTMTVDTCEQAVQEARRWLG